MIISEMIEALEYQKDTYGDNGVHISFENYGDRIYATSFIFNYVQDKNYDLLVISNEDAI